MLLFSATLTTPGGVLYFPSALGYPDDLTTYDESDSSNRFTVTSSTITVNQQDRQDDLDWVKKYGGLNEYSSFELDFDIKCTEMPPQDGYHRWRGMVAMFSDTNNADWGYHVDNNLNAFAIAVDNIDTSGSWGLRLVNRHGATNNNGVKPEDIGGGLGQLTVGTQYYLRLTKSGTTLTLYVYLNEARTSLRYSTPLTLLGNYAFDYFYAITSVSYSGSYTWSGVVDDYDFGLPAPTYYISELNETDLLLWTCINYVSNTTTNHKLEYDTDSGFGSVDGTLWSNSTDAPFFYVPNSEVMINETMYYRVTVTSVDYSETGDYTYTTTPNESNDLRASFPSEQYIGGNYSPANASLHILNTDERHIWVDPVSGKWITKTGSGNTVKIWETSNRGLNWYPVTTLTVDTDYPEGWTHGGSWGGFEYDGSYYYLVLEGDHLSGKGSFLYRGSSLSSLAYYGKICDYASGFPYLTKNCRARDIWYNETDDHLWFAIGGASDTKGAWDYVYVVCDTDDDLTIDDEEGSAPTTLVYNISSFGAGAWADSFVYPAHQVLWDWTNKRGMGVVMGCGSDLEDYDFEAELYFPTSPVSIGTDDFYQASTAVKGFYGSFFDTGQSKSVGMTDIMDTCLIWENSGAMFTSMKESETSGASDPDAGDRWLGLIRGWFPDVMIGLEPGYSAVNRYYEIPTESQFRVNIFTCHFWSTDYVNITVDHLDGSSPTYGSFDVNKTENDISVTMKIRGLTSDTCYLHRTNHTRFWEYDITSSSVGAIATLTPGGSGDDFMFTFNQTGEIVEDPEEGGEAPTADSVEIVSGWDGYALYRDKSDWIKFLVLVGDTDGYDDIETVYLNFHLGEPEPEDPNYRWTYGVSAKEWTFNETLYGYRPFEVSTDDDDLQWVGYSETNQLGVPFVFRVDPGCPITWNLNITGGGSDSTGNSTRNSPETGYDAYSLITVHILDSGSPDPGSSSGSPGSSGTTVGDEPEPGDPDYVPPGWTEVYDCTLTYEERVELYNELRYMTIRELRELCQDMDLDHQSWTIKEPYILLIFVDGYGCQPPDGVDLDPMDLDGDGLPNDAEIDPWDPGDSRRLGVEIVLGAELVPRVFRDTWVKTNFSWIAVLVLLLLVLMWASRETEERDLIDIFKPLRDVR